MGLSRWICLLGLAGIAAAGRLPGAAEKQHPFDDNVKVTVTSEHLVVHSNGIPNHPTGEFPGPRNPNRILKQDYTFYVPRRPKRAEKITPLPMGPIGVAVNGIPFYNPYNGRGQDAVSGLYAEIFDSCCGHPDQLGRYHYHKYPECLKTPFKDENGRHSPLIGYAFDGYGVYGPHGEDGKAPGDLDECNGHEDRKRGYHYHASTRFPYLIGGYRGQVEMRNFDRQRMHRPRPGQRFPFPPPPHRPW